MPRIPAPRDPVLLAPLLLFAAASLIHFWHNAEYLRDYPNLPESWTRAGVYLSWVGMTVVGVAGWLVADRGYRRSGYAIMTVYAVLGIDSVGHYLVAPFSAHSIGANVTILLEVSSGCLVFGVLFRGLALSLPKVWGAPLR